MRRAGPGYAICLRRFDLVKNRLFDLFEKEEKGTTDDKMGRWYHQLNGHEFEQSPGDSEGQGSLAFCSLWDRKESYTRGTEQQQQRSSSSYKAVLSKFAQYTQVFQGQMQKVI